MQLIKIHSLFYLFWLFSSLLLSPLPLSKELQSSILSGILFGVVGIYLIVASSLSYWVIKKTLSGKNSVYNFLTAGFIGAGFGFLGHTLDPGMLRNALFALATAGLLLAATFLGILLSSAIKRMVELVPVCLTATAADVVSVFFGPSRDLAHELTAYYQEGAVGSPPIIDIFLIKAGIPGYQIPVPLFGVSDWIVVVLLSSSVIRLQRSDNICGEWFDKHFLYIPVTVVGLYCSLIVAQLSHSFLPALVFICGFFLMYIFVKFKVLRDFRGSDFIYSLVFPVLVAGTVLILSL